ncbi:unnamed protein product, partial [Polarella glacialis]
MGPPLPPREGQKMQSCYHRLTKPQQREFRRYIESGEEDHAVLAKLAAENAVARPSSRGSSKEPGAYMWPWMRDLKIRLRAGRGWAPTEDGAPRMQDFGGTQVWESRAARSPEEATKPSSLLVPGAAEAIASTAGLASGGASPGIGVRATTVSAASSGQPVRVIARLSKQSGILGVRWHPINFGWQLRYHDQKDPAQKKQLSMGFAITHYQKPGMSWEEAEEAARLAAKAAREDLIKRGNIKDTPSKISKPKFTSNVAGVTWTESSKSWHYRLRDQTVRPEKLLGGGFVKANDTSEAEIFRARAEAEEKMNELYDKHGLQRHVWGADKEVKSASELIHRESSVPGVKWEPTEDCWHTRLTIDGKCIHRRFRPKDGTPEEVDRCHQECVAAQRELKERK